MSTEYLVVSSAPVPTVRALAAAFPSGLRVTGDWDAGIKVGDELLLQRSTKDPRAKDALPAAQRKSVFVAQGDFDLTRAFAKHVAGVMLSEDGDVLERFDGDSDAALPKTMFIVPKKARAKLPDSRRVFESLSLLGDAEGHDWGEGYVLYGVHARAATAKDRVPSGAPAGTVVVSLADVDDEAMEDAVEVIASLVRLVGGKLVASDGAAIALPSF